MRKVDSRIIRGNVPQQIRSRRLWIWYALERQDMKPIDFCSNICSRHQRRRVQRFSLYLLPIFTRARHTLTRFINAYWMPSSILGRIAPNILTSLRMVGFIKVGFYLRATSRQYFPSDKSYILGKRHCIRLQIFLKNKYEIYFKKL